MKKCRLSFRCYMVNNDNGIGNDIICILFNSPLEFRLDGWEYSGIRLIHMGDNIVRVFIYPALSNPIIDCYIQEKEIVSGIPISYEKFLFYVKKTDKVNEILKILATYKEKLEINPF